jgi:hypothetical protein
MHEIGVFMDEDCIGKLDESDYKSLIKSKVRQNSLKKLRKKEQIHMKVKHLDYSNLKSPQQCLKSREFSDEEVSLLFNLICKSENSLKDNFHIMFGKLFNVTTVSQHQTDKSMPYNA